MYFDCGANLPDSLDWKSNVYGYANLASTRIFPSTIHVDSKIVRYFFRYLVERACSVFEWTIPESVERNYFLYTLYTQGYGFVFNTTKYGTIFNHGGLSGYDIYYQPRFAVVANPLLQEEYGENAEYYAHMTIGKDCAVIRLTPEYMGIMDICKYYSEMLGTASSSLITNLFNTKFAYIFGAKDKTTAETLKKIYDNITSGNPAVFTDKKLFDENGNLSVTVLNSSVKNIYIGSELLQDIRAILNDFDSCIGIPNSNLSKKERLITDEANMNNFETKSLCYLWLDQLKKDIKKSNEMFPEFQFNVNFRRELIESAKPDSSNTADSLQHG